MRKWRESGLVLLLGLVAATLPASPERLDINGCTYEELVALPGIGPHLADEILIDASLAGEFREPRDLLRVHGIGPVVLERLRPLLSFGASIASSSAAKFTVAALPPVTTSSRGESPVASAPVPIDLNRAIAADLEQLPGIGPRTAQRILAYRDYGGGFKDLREILRVPGIGLRKAMRLKRYLQVIPLEPEPHGEARFLEQIVRFSLH